MKFALTATTLVVTLLSCIGSTVRCQTILVPSKLHVGENNTLLLISSSDSTATLRLSTQGHTSTPSQLQFRKGELVEWPLLLDNSLPYKEKVTLDLTFDNGAKSSEEFDVSPVNGFLFFQTDKPIYRVSEKVRFRILRLNRALSPINEKVVLKIQNHQTIKVEEVSLQTKPPMHIAEHSFSFPLIAKPGTWKADVHYGPNQSLHQSIEFDVTEYVLPLFSIELLTPKYVINSESILSNVPIGMNVTYTYGKPVRGTVHFRYGVMTLDSSKGNFMRTSNTFCFDNGVFNHTANLAFLKEFASENTVRFIVEAIVKECATNSIERNQNSQMLVVNQPYSISLRKTIRKYKKMVKNYVTFEVLDPHSQPVADVPISLHIASKEKVPVTLHPYIVSSAENRTDKNGQIIFLFQTSNGNKAYETLIKTADFKYTSKQQSMATFTLEPFDPNENEYIWIENKKQLTFTVGDRFTSHIERHTSLETFYLIVMSKGAVIHREKVASNQIDFKLTNRMVPSVRILVLAFTEKGHYVADSLLLKVESGSCFVDISVAQKRILPGSTVNFAIKGRKNDVVGFHAVDEAIYILRQSAKNSSRTIYRKSLEQSDCGCGPGGGANSVEVIRSAGFKALSPDSRNKFSDLQVCKSSSNSRRRRNVQLKLTKEEQLKYMTFCCNLGRKNYGIRMACKYRSEKVQKYYDEDCALEFLKCCNNSTTQIFQASAPTTTVERPDSKNIPETSGALVDEGDASMVRQDFRDTWLFDLLLLKDNTQNYPVVSPHSITTWFISTISISQEHGFCLNSQHKIVTFKQFFIKVSFPQTIIQHEQTEISVTVFNYLSSKKTLTVRISLNKVKGICADWGAKKAIRNVSVIGMSSARMAFAIVPTDPGVYAMKIEAKTGDFSDTVIKNLTVLAPGIEKEHQLTFDLDPLNRAKRATRVEGNFYVDETVNKYQRTHVSLNSDAESGDWIVKQSNNIVPKTLHYVVTAVGERFSPQMNSIEELGKLIKKPKGCGEQNMYYMAFNLFTLLYLEKVGKLDEKIKSRGVRYLNRALANQLSFRKPDGSFSAFQKRSSSIWLTSFVAKVLCQSGRYIGHDIDPKVIRMALQWLQSKQRMEGSWQEEYTILHEKALGGVQGTVPLTAYLIISLSECRQHIGKMNSSEYSNLQVPLEETVQKATQYVIRQFALQDKKRKDLFYSQALIAYALTFGEQEEARQLRKRLTDLLSAASTIDRKKSYQFWKGDYSIETASYALMAFLGNQQKVPDILNYIQIVNWLSAQEKKGTFDNTQDTIVALEALSKYYALYKEKEANINLHNLYTNVTFDTRLKRSLRFDSANADILQTIKVDENTSKIGFETTGNGLGKVNLLIIYNEYNQNKTCRFDLEVDVYEYKHTSIASNVIDSQFDDSFFESKDHSKLIHELGGFKEKPNNKGRKSSSIVTFNETAITSCCLESRLAKRSVPFWSHLANSFRNRPQSPPRSSVSNSHSKRAEPRPAEKSKKLKEFRFAPLPDLKTLSDLNTPIVLVLNICVRYSAKEKGMSDGGLTEMAILEVSILSGYRPVDIDLKAVKEDASNYIEHYDISASKVTFYFRTVPSARLYCLQFRIYQEHRVEKIQSSLVRLYNYYEQEFMCTRLYSSIRQTDYLDVKCEERCRCVTSRMCPDDSRLKEIIEQERGNWNQAQNDTIELFNEYSHVFNGTVTAVNLDDTKAPFLLIQRDPNGKICGDYQNSTVVVYLNPECTRYAQEIKIGTEIIVGHSPGRDSKWLLDGGSLLMNLNENYRNQIHNFIIVSYHLMCNRQR